MQVTSHIIELFISGLIGFLFGVLVAYIPALRTKHPQRDDLTMASSEEETGGAIGITQDDDYWLRVETKERLKERAKGFGIPDGD